jgi:hypothetical protein
VRLDEHGDDDEIAEDRDAEPDRHVDQEGGGALAMFGEFDVQRNPLGRDDLAPAADGAAEQLVDPVGGGGHRRGLRPAKVK